MRSIALFPCTYTNGASILGELISVLQIPVYNDVILFTEVSEQFGLTVEELQKVICQPLPAQHRYRIKLKKYISCMRYALGLFAIKPRTCRLHYGQHISLLDSQADRVLKVLIVDKVKKRVKRAMEMDRLSEKRALEQIVKHDKKVSDWTRFLFQKEPYDRSLYDLVICQNNRSLQDIVGDIISHIEDPQRPTQLHRLPASRKSCFSMAAPEALTYRG